MSTSKATKIPMRQIRAAAAQAVTAAIQVATPAQIKAFEKLARTAVRDRKDRVSKPRRAAWVRKRRSALGTAIAKRQAAEAAIRAGRCPNPNCWRDGCQLRHS